ncbi:MAG: FlgD immunoglobulin-like domain containing protein [Bacteroidota bacterium]
MKKNLLTSVVLTFLFAGLAYSQVPAEQDTIIIEGGVENLGNMETIINADTLTGGGRINPDRVYMLRKNTIYYQQSIVIFDGDSDATLSIVGEEGEKKPVIVFIPPEGLAMNTNLVTGSIVLKNTYWHGRDVYNGTPAGFMNWLMLANNTKLVVEDCVYDVGWGRIFGIQEVKEGLSVFFKNSYFRDMSDPWMQWVCQVIGGDEKSPIDTIWIENTTMTNTGLALATRHQPIKVGYFNHNTFINETKYWLQSMNMEQAYYANNMFINCNWLGEDINHYAVQHLDSMLYGIINVDTLTENTWMTGFGYVPSMDDAKILISDNLQWVNRLLYPYYEGAYNDVADYAVSYLTEVVDSSQVPVPVENTPAIFMNDLTRQFINDYDNIIATTNYENDTDPGLVTPSVASQEAADSMAIYAQSRYGVPDIPEVKHNWHFGDFNAGTVPGIETEEGDGITQIADLVEDFSYTANIRSEIDGRPLGALHWWPEELATWDSEEGWNQVLYKYNNPDFISGVSEAEVSGQYIQSYPNPFSELTQIGFQLDHSAIVNLTVYNIHGQQVVTLVNQELPAGAHTYQWNGTNASGEKVTSGMYIYKLDAGSQSMTGRTLFVK